MPLPGTREDGEWGTRDQLGQQPLVSPGQPDMNKPHGKERPGMMTLPGSHHQGPDKAPQPKSKCRPCRQPGSASSPPGASPAHWHLQVPPLRCPPCPAHPPTLLATVAGKPGPGPCLLFSHPGTPSCSACGLLSPALALCAAASLLHHPLHPAPRAQACYGLPFCLVTLDLRFGPPLRGLPGPSKSP